MSATSCRNYKWEPKKKTGGDQLKDMAIYMAIMLGVWIVLSFIFRAITWPIRVLFRSCRESFKLTIEQKQAKVIARTQIREAFDDDESNPLFQYIERFKIHPELYLNNPENAMYKEWFENMKSGNILDTELKWAPDFYCPVKGELVVNQDFLNYFSRQVELHQSSSSENKEKFLVTILKFYPEFTPKYPKIVEEVEAYREEVKSGVLRDELMLALGEEGLSKKVADVVLELVKDSQELKRAILVLKDCDAKGFSEEMGLYCIRFGYDPNHEKANFVNVILNGTGNEDIASAMARGIFEAHELNKLFEGAVKQGGYKEQILERVNQSFRSALRDKCQSELCGGKL